ncbi:FKBP-type peptidyl-prolyl cis-trans isomerase [Winogradskyella poriferorum]|uniref:FKBP-type peptidyl-prolyl cis-trans isomerase n=1 Tax=Winogradskyella poriferorum TaxID=307627 RepID=UPI003D659B49
MKSIKFIVYLVFVSVVVISCKKDDDVTVPDVVIRDRGEQQLADSDSLIDYLSTHYYNSDFFLTGTNHKYTDIIITELAEGEDVPTGHTLLLDAVETHTTTYQEADYEYYVLRLNQGGGESPSFTDQVRMRYEGFTLADGDVFDSLATPEDLYLIGTGFNPDLIRAWQLIIPMFNCADSFMNSGGITNFNNFGLGVMFVPSGLGFYSGTASGTVAAYSNLIFKFELLQYEEVDHDGDGIPSYVEDIDANLDVLDDDTDEDLAPNFVDIDDDGDGVNTFDELMSNTYTVDTNVNEEEPVLDEGEYEVSRSETAGIITINTVKVVDSDNNGTPDYLQEDIAINYNEESE